MRQFLSFLEMPGAGIYPVDSRPPNCPKQPQFTNWSQVTPFALERANPFRPGPPPALTSDTYSDVFNEVKSLGIAGSTAATADQALPGRFWNGAIQNYWNEIAQTAAVAHNLDDGEERASVCAVKRDDCRRRHRVLRREIYI